MYRASPPVADGTANDGPISLGAEFHVTSTGCTLNGFRVHEGNTGTWTGTITAALYAVGGSTPLTTAVTILTPGSSDPAGYWPGQAFDGSTSTWWLGTSPKTGGAQWLKTCGDSASTVTQYSITPHPSSNAYSPKDFKFQGSNDGTTWIDLDTRTGVTWSSTAAQVFNFTNSNSYRQYRLYITDVVSATDYVAITEFSVTGHTHSGYGETMLATPYALTSGTNYRAVFYFTGTRANANGSFNTTLTSGPLVMPSGATSVNGNHTYVYGSGMQNPTNAAGSNYKLDVWIDQPGGTTHNGAAALSATSTLTATAAGTVFSASAPLSASSTLSANGNIGAPIASASASLAASSTLTATPAATRPVSAALTSTSVLRATAQATVLQAIASMTATSVLSATPDPPKTTAAEAPLYAASALFAEADQTGSASVAMTSSSSLTVDASAFTPFTEPLDPRTGKPQYRLIIAHRDGTRLAEVTNAHVAPIEDGVGVGSSFNFELPASDPKRDYITPAGRQAQVWRGTELEFRGPIVTIDDDDEGRSTVKCRDPFWYLESGRRVIGQIPKRNLLVNGSFATGEPPWTGAYAPDSIPAAQPVRDVISTDFFGVTMNALQIRGVDKVVTVTKEVKTEAVFVPNQATYLPGGEAAIKAVAALMPKTGNLSVRVEGYTADNRINGDYGDGMALSLNRAKAAAASIKSVRPNAVTTTVGFGYYHQIPGGLAANRRVVISWSGVQEASGHRQYEVQKLSIVQPVAKKAPLPLTFVGWTWITKWIGPSKDGWGVYIQAADPTKPADPKKPTGPRLVIDSAHADIDEKTPRDRWMRMEATIEIPADGRTYDVEVRLYPPAGEAMWTMAGLYPADQLGFFKVDQANIIKGLVEHAQDTSIGKGDLGIGTRCQPTGVTRTREYPYHERMPIETAIGEIASLYRGPEVVMEVTPTAQTVVTYYPRQGSLTSEVLVHGGNVTAYEAPSDSREVASSIILQADGWGADREEGYASDPAALDGLMLERVVSTEGDTPVTELEEGAQRQLKRLKTSKPAVWVTIHPSRTSEVMDAWEQGDWGRLIIEQAGIDGLYRFVKRRLHPGQSDLLEMMLTPCEQDGS
ncbi:hypothetical protein GCM10027053_52070 [Intrasporangium mesophilum]